MLSFLKRKKAIKADAKSVRQFQREKYIKDGNAYLDIYFKDELYDPYSNLNMPNIKWNIYEYIYSELRKIALGCPLTLSFHVSKELEDECL